MAKKWTILRMAYYAEAFIDEVRMFLQRGVHASTSNTPVNFVSRDEVAAAAAGILAGDAGEGHRGAIYQATGPAAFDGAGRAALVAKVTGKSFAFVPVSAEQYREGLAAAGLPPFVVDAVLNIREMWSVGGFDVTTGDVERLAGRPPESLEDALRDRGTGLALDRARVRRLLLSRPRIQGIQPIVSPISSPNWRMKGSIPVSKE